MNIKLINKVIAFYGGTKGVMDRFEYKTTMAVYQWRRQGIPKKYHGIIAKETGITMRRLKRCQP